MAILPPVRPSTIAPSTHAWPLGKAQRAASISATNRVIRPFFHFVLVWFLLGPRQPSGCEPVSQGFIPGEPERPGSIFLLGLSRRVSEIDIGPQEADRRFLPGRLFQIHQELCTEIGPVLFKLQLPTNPIGVQVRMLLGEQFESFVIHTQQRLTLRTPRSRSSPRMWSLYVAKRSESPVPDPPV